MDPTSADREGRGSKPGSGKWLIRRRTLLEGAYIVMVAGMAAYGFSGSGSTAIILAAVAVTLPSGLPALVAYYVTYGLLAQVPGANPDTHTGSQTCTADNICEGSSTGDLAPWFAATTEVIGVVLLTVAAVANVVLLRRVSRRGSKAKARLGPDQ